MSALKANLGRALVRVLDCRSWIVRPTPPDVVSQAKIGSCGPGTVDTLGMSVAAPQTFSPAGAPAENWDDDFLFQAEDSPAKAPRRKTSQRHVSERWSVADTVGWDEELEREEAERQSSASSSLGPATGRPDLSRWAENDEDDDFGFVSRRGSAVEDTVSPLPVFPTAHTMPSPSKRARTNTSPSRSSTSTASLSARSSPVMPTRQVPSSPALSLFSMSTSTAQQYTPSLASSTAHLRTTTSRDASSPVGPFIPPQPRVPRRRLRKKSRPARPGDIAEDDVPAGYLMREPSPQGLGLAMTEEEEASWSESSNQPERTPSPVQSPAGPSSPPTRTPLLTRIGSITNKLGRKPKSSYPAPSPPSTSAPPTTPGRSRSTRPSTTPKAPPQTPRARQASWFRPSQNGSSPEDSISPHQVTRRKSKEPFWKNVGSFSSGRSPVTHTSESEKERGEGEQDHESTVKKPPRKSTSNVRPPLPNSDVFPLPLPSLPAEPGSPTPPGGKLTKSRRPMSMGGPAASSKPSVGRTAASLGRGTGLGWASTLAAEEDKEKESSILRSLRKFSSSHTRKRSGGEDVGVGMPRVPSSSVGSSRVPSSSTGTNTSSRRPSLSMSAGVARTASMSAPTGPRAVPMLKSASAVVLSSAGAGGHGREFNPTGSVFTLPLGRDDEDERPSLTIQVAPEIESPTELRSSSSIMERPSMSELRPPTSHSVFPPTPHSRPSSPLVPRPLTPSSRPTTPILTERPSLQSTPHGVRVMTPHTARPSSPLATRRPSTPLAGPPVVFDDEDEDEEDERWLEHEGGLDTVPEGELSRFESEMSRYDALDAAQKQAWLDAVAALPTPAPDPTTPPPRPCQSAPIPIIEEDTHGGRRSLGSSGRKSTSTESGYRHSNSIGRSKLHRKSASAHAKSKSASEPTRIAADLLPPIELQPPSPPQTLSGRTSVEQTLLSLSSPRLHARLGTNSPIGQSSSLGRAATQPGGSLDGSVLRRNSLSDLKIPARISRAQSGLKSNLGMVREFAASIEQIRGLQTLYRNLLADLRYAIENNEPLSPVLFPPASRSSATSMTLVRVPSRDIGRVTDRLNGIDERYSLWWECAEVLVELGGGNTTGREGGSTEKSAAPASSTSPDTTKDGKGRERAITLAGNQSAPTVEPAAKKDWEKSGELSPRQLHILREMLACPNPAMLSVPAMVNPSSGYLNALHPGGTASAITLPSSSASSHVPPVVPKSSKPTGGKIRRASRAGITGIRDLLKYLNLKKPIHSDREGSRPSTRLGGESRVSLAANDSKVNLAKASQVNLGIGAQSQVNLPTNQSQLNLGSQAHLPRYPSRSHGPSTTVLPIQKSSPRRPSLASIFRLNGRNKSKARVVSNASASSATEDDQDESDWDRMDSASDMDLHGKIRDESAEEKDATLRGRKSGSGGRTSHGGRPPVPALPAEFANNKSQLSLAPNTPEDGVVPELPSASAIGGVVIKKGSNRFRQRPQIALAGTSSSGVPPSPHSAPLQPGGGYPSQPPSASAEGRLALTPENIKPLLEYAREVTTRLGSCVAELRELGVVDPETLNA